MDKKISLVIPAYNEAAIIEDTISAALQYLDCNFMDYELIIADDGSTDDTKNLVLKTKNPRLRCTSYPKNKGKGCAVREGVLASEGDIIVYTDADLAYGLEVVGSFVDKLVSDGAALAIGSRKLHPKGYADYPPIRLLASRSFSFVTGLFAGFQYDTQCGIKAFCASAAKEVFSRTKTDGFAFDFEVMMISKKLGLKIQQLPVMIVNHRESKVRVIRDSIKMFGDVIRIRRCVNKRMRGE